MTKYMSKEHNEIVIDVRKVKEDETIETAYGPALITAGNYVATVAADESQFGITQNDLDSQYEKYKKTSKAKAE